jgi:transcription elongation GreA/GreB family factor
MPATRMTSTMRRSLERRLADLEERIAMLDAQRDVDESVDAAALKVQLTRERSQIVDAMGDATLIDDEPFDTHAIEVGDLVTVQGHDGDTERYVLVDEGVGTRARSDWVSVGSPLGRMLLGRSKGDEVQVESPGGVISYVIIDFERASEDHSVFRPRGRVIPPEPSTSSLSSVPR